MTDYIKRKYKVELLTDVILNQKAATEGPNATLEFIPGNCFLGIVASRLYKEVKAETAMQLFHTGDVRYGDAHPAHVKGEKDYVRTLKVPAVMYSPKYNDDKEYFINYAIPDSKKEEYRTKQLKQERTGFYDFSVNPAFSPLQDKSFSIKSAHDKEKGASEKSAMYGYQALCKGQVFLFEIETKTEELMKLVDENIRGSQRIGRSKSAQYGLVEITQYDFKEGYIQNNDFKTGSETSVYADGRLIFLNEETGMPTFQPSVSQLLGVSPDECRDVHIEWEKSQVRTFSYSPWNAQRQSFDTERCGIEKGSVFVLENCKISNTSKCVGCYNNEGFGKVIYNPDFLQANNIDGKAVYSLKKEERHQPTPKDIGDDTDLLKFLNKKKEDEGKEYGKEGIYDKVNKYIEDNKKYFIGTENGGKRFAHQWGTIRKLAMISDDCHTIENYLFNGGYLEHGVAVAKWKADGRKDRLEAFLKQFDNNEVQKQMLINLASEMAKICRNKEDK